MKITDLLTLNDFVEAWLLENGDIKHVQPLSNGEKSVDEISSYYTDSYKGTTAFFQIAEVIQDDQLLTIQCSLTIASKPADVSVRAGLVTRDHTLKLMLERLGRLHDLADQSAQETEDMGDMYELVIKQGEKIYPIGLMTNVHLEGHYIDLDITVPVKHLMYPN